MRNGQVKLYLFILFMGMTTSTLVSAADQMVEEIPYSDPASLNQSSAAGQMGENLYNEMGCIECHGPRGYSKNTGIYPRIAGLDKQYIVDRLLAFQSGARQNVIMSPIAATLTIDDVTALAVYISANR